jgi:hypothetical protein
VKPLGVISIPEEVLCSGPSYPFIPYHQVLTLVLVEHAGVFALLGAMRLGSSHQE